MTVEVAQSRMTSEEISKLAKEHTFFSWSVQGAVDPIAIDHAEGVWLYTPEGKRILDFNSQLMSVNIGHGDQRVVRAITEQATKLQFVQPAFVTEIRARTRREVDVAPPGRSRQGVLHARRRGGDRERDQDRAPVHRPLQDSRPVPRLPRGHDGRDDLDWRSAPVGDGTGTRGRCAIPRYASLGRT